MQTPGQLVPKVHPTGDRGVFDVDSRSGRRPWRVDIEARAGLGSCTCPDFQYNHNYDCWHIGQVRKYVCCAVGQNLISRMKAKDK